MFFTLSLIVVFIVILVTLHHRGGNICGDGMMSLLFFTFIVLGSGLIADNSKRTDELVAICIKSGGEMDKKRPVPERDPIEYCKLYKGENNGQTTSKK